MNPIEAPPSRHERVIARSLELGTRRVDPEVLRVLGAGEARLNAFVLSEALGRTLYAAVDRVLVAAGGRWDRRAGAHVFDGDAAEAVDAILSTGMVMDAKTARQAFYTPAPLAERLVAEAGVRPGDRVLEPSVGHGAIVRAVLKARGVVWGWEIDEGACAIAQGLFEGGGLYRGDFLGADPAPVFDRVVMNPPFARQADIRHVRHAFGFLRPGVRLVSVMSFGVLDRTDSLSAEFRQFVHGLGGHIAELPDDSFAASGTHVRTVVVIIDAQGGSAR